MDALVSDHIRRHGWFAHRPTVVNPLDDVTGLRRAWRSARLKEWVGFAVFHPEVWLSMIVQDAKYLASSEVITYAVATGADHRQAVGTSSAASLPRQLFDTTTGLTRGDYEVRYDFADPGEIHRIRVRTAGDPRIEADLELDGAHTPPVLALSHPLPMTSSGPIAGDLFTYKCIYPVSGTLRIGGETFTYDPDRDLAILDEHRSRQTYHTDWVWGTFATRTGDGIVGANFVRRPKAPGGQEESCLWGPRSLEPISDVDFDHDDGPDATWRIRSADGRLDVTFEPVNRESVHHQLGVFAADYFMCQGRYSGTITVEGSTRVISEVHGVVENMHARM